VATAAREAVRAVMACEPVEVVKFRTAKDGRIVAATRERMSRSEAAELHLGE